MDIVIGLLALVASLGGGAGLLINQSAEQFLNNELDRADVLEVRVQSAPNYRLLNGQADRLLIAGRGLYRKPFPRIEVLELETDPLAINPSSLRGGPIKLDSPLQAAIRVVVKAEDLNSALESPEILSQFQNIKADLPFGSRPNQPQSRFDLLTPRAEFQTDNRIQLSAQLMEKQADGSSIGAPLDIVFSAGLEVEKGQTLRLVNPEFTVGSVRVPEEISGAFLGGLNQVFNLSDLESQGITLRILKFAVNPQTLEVIGFVKINSLS